MPPPSLPWLERGMEGLQKFPQPTVGDRVGNRIGSLRTCCGRASVVKCEVTHIKAGEQVTVPRAKREDLARLGKVCRPWWM